MPRGAGSAGRQRPRELPLGGRAVRRGDEASLAAPQRGAGGRFGELTGPAATAPPDIAAAGQRVAIARPRGIRYDGRRPDLRSEEHTSELQSLMRISYAVFCLKKKKNKQ